MPETDVLKRLLDAGVTFGEMTQQRAEALVNDLVQLGAVQTEQASKALDQLLARSSERREKLVQESEALIENIRSEIEDQLARLGIATKDDVASLRRRLDKVADSVADAAGRAESAVRDAAAMAGARASAKRAARKSAAKKAAKKSAAKKSAKKSAAKKSAKKSAAKKSAKKSAAKKSAR